jgi:hypothetical protein
VSTPTPTSQASCTISVFACYANARTRGLQTLASDSRLEQSWSVAKKQWSDLSPRIRRLILIGGAFEGALKVAALVDLARRPREEVRGSKPLWAAAIVLINSVGGGPIAYFVYGRRRT